MPISESLPIFNLTPVILKTFWNIYLWWEWTRNLIFWQVSKFCWYLITFQVGIVCLGGTVFSGGTLYPSANYDSLAVLNQQSLRRINHVHCFQTQLTESCLVVCFWVDKRLICRFFLYKKQSGYPNHVLSWWWME